MSSGYTRPHYNPRDDYGGGGLGGMNQYSMHPHDYANWGFIILYLVIILGSLLGNGFFLLVVKKNPSLHRTAHYMLSTLAIRDIIVTIMVIPFVIDSQVRDLQTYRQSCHVIRVLDPQLERTALFVQFSMILFGSTFQCLNVAKPSLFLGNIDLTHIP